jgi:hypothetical protein
MDASKFHPETPGAKLVDIMSFFNLGTLDTQEISMTYYCARERFLITEIHFIFTTLKEDS